MNSIPRFRERVQPTKSGLHSNYRNGVPQGFNVQSDTESLSEACDDFVTPDFTRLIRSGAIINNPCSIVVDHRSQMGSGTYHGVRASNGWVYEVYGDGSMTEWLKAATFWDPPNMAEFEKESILQHVRQQCLARVDKSPYEFAEDVGELGTTARYFYRRGKGLYVLLKAMRRRAKKLVRRKKNGKEIFTQAQALAQVWLEYRFAIMPLVRSMMKLLEALPENVHRPKRRNARAFEDYKSAGDSGIYTATGGFGLPVDFALTDEISADVAAVILYEVDNPAESFQYKYGLRFSDIPETAWNLLPLSFMVDRLLDMSAFWRGITNLANPSIQKLAGSTRVKVTYERTCSAFFIHAGSWGVINLSTDTVYTKQFEYERIVWDPSFIDAIPTLDIKGLLNSVTKTADLLALATQFLR